MRAAHAITSLIECVGLWCGGAPPWHPVRCPAPLSLSRHALFPFKINRSLIRRLARRLTIGIPILGLYYIGRIMRKDARSLVAAWAAGDRTGLGLYGFAVSAELVDLGAQALITLSAGVCSGLIVLPAGLAAAALAPAMIAAADKVSIACAAAACGAGMLAEAHKVAAAEGNESQKAASR